MFDSAWIDIKCPYCGQTSKIECQTKELDCTLECWNKGDFVGDKTLPYLECIADCHSDECMDWQTKKDGYRSGFGRMFFVNVKLDEGVVTGDYEITDASD